METTGRPTYRYVRPFAGQVEEIWFEKLPPLEQARVLLETQEGIAFRVEAWNASHPKDRQFPRPEERRARRQFPPAGTTEAASA